MLLAHYELLAEENSDSLRDVESILILGLSRIDKSAYNAGWTNQFLVEIADEVALNYNDQSPLENMHCAKFFDILRDPKSNVFGE